MALALFALTVHGLKARRIYRDQIEKDSIHELRGCLMTLEAVLLGPDWTRPVERQSDYASRSTFLMGRIHWFRLWTTSAINGYRQVAA
jgi:hypothetical protein